MSEYAIIAGSGMLPKILSEKIDCKIISFEGQGLDNLQSDLKTSIGKIGEITEYLKVNNIKKIIFAGGIKKPKISEIETDLEGKKLLAKIAVGKLFSKRLPGDNKVLVKIITYLEESGFEVIGAHEIALELLAESGDIAGSGKGYEEDIELGTKAAKELGKQDKGQAVIVSDGEVTQEDESGTEELIKKCKAGVLVKCKKPQQDERVDLPTIGPDTIEQLRHSGLAGVAVEAGASLILDKDQVIEKANEYGIFVVGV